MQERFLRDAGMALALRDPRAQALLPDIVIVRLECVCGGLITDGPFRFCVDCRQVDLQTMVRGGR